MLPLKQRYSDSQIVIITKFVVVSSVGIKGVVFVFFISLQKYMLWRIKKNIYLDTPSYLELWHTIFDLITTHTPKSAQSSNSVAFRLRQCTFYLLYKGICCGYPFELHQLVNAIQMSIHKICYYKDNQKKKTLHKHH